SGGHGIGNEGILLREQRGERQENRHADGHRQKLSPKVCLSLVRLFRLSAFYFVVLSAYSVGAFIIRRIGIYPHEPTEHKFLTLWAVVSGSSTFAAHYLRI